MKSFTLSVSTTTRYVAVSLLIMASLPYASSKIPSYPDLMTTYPRYEEYAHRVCEFAEATEIEKGQTLYNITKAEIARDEELHRRVLVLAKRGRPYKGCELVRPPVIKYACYEGLDPETGQSDRADYEWRAMATYRCPGSKNGTTFIQQMEIFQVGD